MEYERLYPRTRVSANLYIRLVPEEFIKYEICCEGKHGNVHAIYAMRNLHPEGLFTVRLLKVFAYIPTATLCVVVFKLHRYYISDAPDACNIRRSLLTDTKQRVASIDYRTSRS